MSSGALDAVVVGAGVVGLTTAIVLAESGFSVRIVAREGPEGTASASSGAIWGPFLSDIDARLRRWSYDTLEILFSLVDSPSGVEIVEGVSAELPGAVGRWWVEDFAGSHVCDRDKLPLGYSRGWNLKLPVIDMPVYLDYLVRRLTRQGAEIEYGVVETLGELTTLAGHVVVCAGAGSAQLAGDSLMRFSKGQLVIVKNPGLRTFFAERGDGPDLTYILPQGDKVVLGGTAESTFQHVQSEESVSNAIISRCATIDPRLSEVPIIGTRVGIRPCRDSVRIEHSYGAHIIYNYGHGGSGVSISWGCALEVVEILMRCLDHHS